MLFELVKVIVADWWHVKVDFKAKYIELMCFGVYVIHRLKVTAKELLVLNEIDIVIYLLLQKIH
jgi:hypothetical protein